MSLHASRIWHILKRHILIVDDPNNVELKKCQAKLKEKQFWAMVFCDSATGLQADQTQPAPENHQIKIPDDRDTIDELNVHLNFLDKSSCRKMDIVQ